MPTFALLALLFALGAALLDLRSEKVDNLWVLFSWGSGLLCHVTAEGARGLAAFLAGAVLPLALLWFLFLFRMMGAGDLKVLSTIGGALGWRLGLACVLWSFLAGAVLSLAILLLERNLLERFQYFFQYVVRTVRSGRRVAYRQSGDEAARIHFTIPILMGTMLVTGGILR